MYHSYWLLWTVGNKSRSMKSAAVNNSFNKLSIYLMWGIITEILGLLRHSSYCCNISRGKYLCLAKQFIRGCHWIMPFHRIKFRVLIEFIHNFLFCSIYIPTYWLQPNVFFVEAYSTRMPYWCSIHINDLEYCVRMQDLKYQLILKYVGRALWILACWCNTIWY